MSKKTEMISVSKQDLESLLSQAWYARVMINPKDIQFKTVEAELTNICQKFYKNHPELLQ